MDGQTLTALVIGLGTLTTAVGGVAVQLRRDPENVNLLRRRVESAEAAIAAAEDRATKADARADKADARATKAEERAEEADERLLGVTAELHTIKALAAAQGIILARDPAEVGLPPTREGVPQ